MLKNKTLMFNI